MKNGSINPDSDWGQYLGPEFEKSYMVDLKKFLAEEYQRGKTIYPLAPDIFNCFNMTPFKDTKVVIIGQDPYHGPGQAHGLSFSVKPPVRMPPSLVNIYKEIKRDLKLNPPTHGSLEHWAKQGVLLLNAVLTVESNRPASHREKGWEKFTDQVVDVLNQKAKGLVFVLWGSFAQKKGKNIDLSKHFVLKAPHPSPLSAHRGFFGCNHFSQVNKILESLGKTPIQWAMNE